MSPDEVARLVEVEQRARHALAVEAQIESSTSEVVASVVGWILTGEGD